jgi:hypothetical protein
MLKQGADEKKIIEATGLSAEVIKDIRDQLK